MGPGIWPRLLRGTRHSHRRQRRQFPGCSNRLGVLGRAPTFLSHMTEVGQKGSLSDGHRVLMASCVPTGTALPSPPSLSSTLRLLSSADQKIKKSGFLLSWELKESNQYGLFFS